MRLGILGGGQLAKMLNLAAAPLGIDCLCLDPVAGVSASHCCEVITADYTDQQALRDFAQRVDVITYENENIPTETLDFLADQQVLPNRTAIEICQDRLSEKTLFNQLGIATAKYAAVDNLKSLQKACQQLGLPALLKTRRLGYDGKGQSLIKTDADIDSAWADLQGKDLILEQFISFDHEVSIIAVRGARQDSACYPLTDNLHQSGILRRSLAPYSNDTLQQQAQQYASTLLDHFNYQGVLAIEFFVADGKLIANEMAPRVHNSGHWTIEGSHCSQFENHVRAICGLALGPTAVDGYSAMYNCIGDMPTIEDITSTAFCHYHDYQKEARANRKLGHVTIHCHDQALYNTLCQQFDRQFTICDR